MPIITDAAAAEIKRYVKTLYGTILTRPTLRVSDGINVTYSADVNISPTDPTGVINQYYKQKKDGSLATQGGFFSFKTNVSGFLTGLPGQAPEDWNLEDSLPGHVNTVLHDVAIANNSRDVVYADVGNPVRLDRSATGQWEITGFSQEQPGTHMLVPVDLCSTTLGTVIDLSVEARLLTLAELGELRPLGELPLGASAIYIGGILDRLV